MANEEKIYVQCGLLRGGLAQVEWLPEEFAVQGSEVKLIEYGAPRNGWLVLSVGARKSASEIQKLRRIDRRKNITE